MGSIVDKYDVTTCILLSTLGSTASIFLLWGFSTSLAPLMCFCIVYGLFAGSFSSTWPGIMMMMKRGEGGARVDGTMVFCGAAVWEERGECG